MTLRKTRCPTLLLTSCYLDREGGGGVGGDYNVPFDWKMTLPKTRCPTLLLTSCYLDREGGWGGGGGDDNVPFDCKMTLPKTRCPTLLLTSCYLDGEGGLGGWGGDDNVRFDWKSTEEKKNAFNLKQMLRNCKSFFWHFDILQQTSKHHRSQAQNTVNYSVKRWFLIQSPSTQL